MRTVWKMIQEKQKTSFSWGRGINDRFWFFREREQKNRKSLERRERRQRQVSGSLKSNQEKMMWRQPLGERQRCPALSFYSPKMEEWEVWPEDSRIDGEKEWRGQKKRRKKNTGNGLGMIAKEAGMWTGKEMQEKQWGQEEKEDKRWCFNELILTVGDVRSSPRLKRITGEVYTFYSSLKAVPTCWINENEDEQRKTRPAI